MIYTLTLNPCIDYVMALDRFDIGITNRTVSEEYYIGGKGINVSRVLAELGMKSTALGFTAGFTGEAIENQLRELGIDADFIRLKNGLSRINVKIKADRETEINSQGPFISNENMEKLLKKIDHVAEGDTLVLAGSIPAAVSDDVYEKILQHVEWRNVRSAVDATGNLLLNCLKYQPFLIKPNLQELSALFGATIADDEGVERCARELLKKGARNVIVSLGGDGAVLFAENGCKYRSGVLGGKAVNTVGAGDSMIAGFIAGFEKTGDYAYAMKLGTACGNATAFLPGLATRAKIAEMLALGEQTVQKHEAK